MVCTYGSFARDLTALNAGLTIAATSGGSITAGTSRWIACQIRTRGGLTLHTTPVQATTTSDNRTISVTIAASAIESGDYPMELIISGAATNDVTQMVRLASWRFRDGKTITYPGYDAIVYPGEGTLRSLPHTVTLTQDAHVALSASVAAAVNLPVTTNLVQGMLRQITATSEVVAYDAEATSGLYAAATGYWKLHLPGFTPINNGAFSTYYGTTPELEGGCDRLVTELGSGQAINLPAYKFDGSPQDPPLILFLNNGFEIEGGSALPKGGSLAIQIKMNDADVSSAFSGRILLQLLGYCDREAGELDTSMAGSAVAWQPGVGAVTLPEDLPRGFAAVYSVAIQARKDEILNSRDFNASALADGAVLTTLLYFEGSLGYLSDLWYFLGDTVLAIDKRMILVPLVNGLRRLGGVALVKGYGTRQVGTYLVDGVLEDEADQQAAISGALNGAIVMREDGEDLADTEALRAIVSTAPGTQSPSAWSSSFSLSTGNQTISITAISTTAIRSDYPDALLAGNSDGENNVPYYRVYVEAPGPTIYELDTPVVVSPTGTTTITIGALGDMTAASLPTSPDAAFGLFGYGSVSGVAASGGSLATGSYRVAIANFYPSPNPEVTAIAHGSIEVLGATVSDLLNQSLPYSRLTDSFVQPSVAGSVVAEVDNSRVFAVGGSVIINSSSLVFQGGYEVTAKTATTLTLTNLGASGSASPGATVPASGFVFPAGAAGPQGPVGASYSGTSTTSLAIASSGSKTLTTQAGLAYVVGSRIRIASAANTANYMEGRVTSYSSTTLIFTADNSGGSGTFADWNLSLAGDEGAEGDDGIDGRTILSGSGAPDSGDGEDGDFYLDTTVSDLYGPKTGGAWGSGTSLLGNDGDDGVDGFGIDFLYDSSTSPTPDSAEIRWNNANPASATAVYISETGTDGAAAGRLDLLTVGSAIQVIKASDSAVFASWEIDSITDNGSDRTYGVTATGNAGSFTNGDPVRLALAIRGGTGATGSVSAASGLTLEHIATPSEPAAGDTILYAKTDGLLYYFPNGGAETLVGSGSGGGGGRELLTANRTYYVRTDGSDSNDGLADSSGGAFLTINKAINVIAGTLDLGGYDVTIDVGNGTYTTPVILKSIIGGGRIIILGDTTTPSNVQISATAADAISGSGSILATYRLSGLRISTSTSGNCINSVFAPNIFIEIDRCEFGSCAEVHMLVGAESFIQTIANYSIAGGAASHIGVYDGGFVRLGGVSSYTVTVTGTPNFSGGFAVAGRGGRILAANQTYSGSATGPNYSSTQGSTIIVVGGAGNGSTTYFPGNAGGNTTPNGIYG